MFDPCIASVRRQARKSSNKSDSKEESGASLSCYDCSGHNPNCGVSKSTLEGGCKACMVYLNVNDGSESSHRRSISFISFSLDNVIRRCCKSNCGEPGTIAPFEGRQAYFCSSSECNGLGAETKLPGANSKRLLEKLIGEISTASCC